jgi:hypothetical protein
MVLRAGAGFAVRLWTKWRSAHPGLKLQVLQPVFYRRDPAEVILDMLLADGPNRNDLADTVRQRRANAFAVMAKGTMADVSAGESGERFML